MLNTNLQKTYEVEEIIDHYSLVFGKTLAKQYLISWKGYGPEYNKWKTLPFLKGCMKLAERYEN